jgi:hypothetical protein
MPFGPARYGATILGYTNASPCVISVDSTAFIGIGYQVIVANVVSSTIGPPLNGFYTVIATTGNTVTIDQDTTLYGAYISGGFVTIEQETNPNSYLQGIPYPPLLPWLVFNQAGIRTGI